MILDTIDTLKRFIEHAPADPGRLAGNLAGWTTPDGVYVCAYCAGRIMARGCQLPRGSEPVWKPRHSAAPCCLCAK